MSLFRQRPWFLVAIVAFSWCWSAQAYADERPNVVVILADDLGFSDLGCYGSEIPTPHIDALAHSGARFSAFYTSARCCPSRASLMTGLHPHQAGIGSFATRRPRQGFGSAYAGHLLPTCVTLAEVLGDAGYTTWMVGKWHMGIPGPIERGFQNYFGYKNFLAYAEDQWTPEEYVRLPQNSVAELEPGVDFYATDFFNDYAVEFLRQASEKEQPFFLYLAHSSPHFPVQAPKETIDRHVETYRQGWDELRAKRLARQKKLGLFPDEKRLPPRSMVPVDREDIANGFPGEPNPAWDTLQPSRQEDLARRGATFAAMVEHVDKGVGRIVEQLMEQGDLDNTLIFFLSDNGACYEWGPYGFDGPSRKGVTILHEGEQLARMGQAGTHSSYGSGWANLGNTPLNMYKHFCHEGGIASPLIVQWPSQFTGSGHWVHDPAHLMDIVPTVLEATAVSYPDRRDGHRVQPLEGVSLLSAVEGAEFPKRALAFEHQQARGLRWGKWKVTWGKRQPNPPRWELYNLENDRSEQHDLASAHPERLSDLVSRWEKWAKRVGAEPFHRAEKVSGPQAGQPRSPLISNRSIRISARVKGQNLQGVVLAHGGRQHGYALHFVDGRPAFDVRVTGRVTRLIADEAVGGDVTLAATLNGQSMSLTINGTELTGKAPGPIPVEPVDPLSVGFDERTSAGDYSPPNRFSGDIIDHQITTEK